MPTSIVRSLFTPLSPEGTDAARHVGHIAGVDILRGLAAVCVVCWHYQFFFQARPLLRGEYISPINRHIEPLYSVLWPIYENGAWAVQLFWMISGVVFTHVYAGRRVSARSFFMARFARLYPLHFITLIAVAAIQAASFHLVGGFQICSLNDAYHFVLNLLFASNWGLQEEMSFNVPVWSVSVEIPIYAAFFFIAPFIFARGLLWPLVIAFGGWFVLHYVTFNSWFAMCAMYFFIGCGIWFLCQKLRGWMVIAISASSYATLAALTILVPKTPWLDSQILLFCPTVMLCTYFGCWSPLGRLRWFGDATYSLYLWHFPIIIVVNTVLAYNQVQRNAFSSPVALFAWVVLMIMVSRVSFRFIERPLQTMILRWLVRSPVADRAEQSSAAASQAVPAGRR